MVSGPRSTGDEEQRLAGDEIDVVLGERRVEFDHVETTGYESK